MPTTDRRVLVLGAGSSGARHARTLATTGARVELADPDWDRAAAVAKSAAGDERLAVTAVAFDVDRMDGYDGIVVASPTSEHARQAEPALATGARVLVEKPLATTAADAEGLVARYPGRLMVGFNLRCHEPIARLMALVHGGRVGRITAVRAWFGSYLPDWRPDTDYRLSYSARAELGGGVLLDAVHELDLLVWLLGPELETVGAVVARLGDLDVDVEDTVAAVLRHRDGAVATLDLDYLARKYRRGLEVTGTDATVRLDWARRVLEIEDGSGLTTEAADTVVAESYQRQSDVFLAWLDDRAKPPVDGPTALASLRLVDGIRRLAK